MAEIGTDIGMAKKYLSEGELVAIPTETVYGLAGNALQPDTVVKIFSTKKRPSFDPLIIHIPSFEVAENYVTSIPTKARKLAERFWPGPLTLVLPKKERIPDVVTAGLPTVGIRCPDHVLTRKLLSQLSFPLAAPSANPFGYVSPTTARHVDDQLGDQIPYILDGGPCPVGIESTIIGFENEDAVIFRRGGITQEEIENTIGPVRSHLHSSSNPVAPGQLKSHYATSTPFFLGDVDALKKEFANKRIGILRFKSAGSASNEIALSPKGDLSEAARNLFSSLRTLDQMDVDLILAEEVPDEGIGKAINDRLRRAAANQR